MIRLYVLEDHSLIVDGLKHRFRHSTDRITIEGWSDDIQHLISNVPEDSFDILILDLWIHENDPVDNISKIKKRFPAKPVVILTYEQSTYWIKLMMEQGVKAYLMKDIDNKELKAILEKVHQGKTIIPDLRSDEYPMFQQNEFLFLKYYLKPSEQSIVFMLSQGESLKEIAHKRCQTVSAIEKILQKIRKRIGVKNNPELIRILFEQKIL
jgi:DNA-binding NarL/FixJ family response regulator